MFVFCLVATIIKFLGIVAKVWFSIEEYKEDDIQGFSILRYTLLTSLFDLFIFIALLLATINFA